MVFFPLLLELIYLRALINKKTKNKYFYFSNIIFYYCSYLKVTEIIIEKFLNPTNTDKTIFIGIIISIINFIFFGRLRSTIETLNKRFLELFRFWDVITCHAVL